MKYPEIQNLYKYMSWNEYTKQSLNQGGFWFSSPAEFNDPIDCGISLNTKGNTPFFTNLIAANISEIGRATGESVRNPTKIDSITESVQKFADSISGNASIISSEINEAKEDQAAYSKLKEKFISSGIMSLSELGDNILMWSHYAQQHRGICIEFERAPTNILGEIAITLPVRYSIKAPIIDAKLYRNATEEEKAEIEQSLVLTKASDWVYEREWRIIKNECANSSQYLNCEIRSITLGLRTEEDAIAHISSLAKTRGFAVKKATLKPNEFGLTINPT